LTSKVQDLAKNQNSITYIKVGGKRENEGSHLFTSLGRNRKQRQDKQLHKKEKKIERKFKQNVN
jgi:hypothetical protein